jgi:uncharacterized protein DUF4232
MTHHSAGAAVTRRGSRRLAPRLIQGSIAVLAALALAAAGFTFAAGPATASRVRPCAAAHLAVRKGTTEAATSHRYTRFRITNTGSRRCRLFGTPTFRFRNAQGNVIGFPSVPAGVASEVVVLEPKAHTRVTLGRVVPAPIRRAQCRPRHSASVDVRLAYRPHVYNLPYDARVCTTRRYRPTAYPVGF